MPAFRIEDAAQTHVGHVRKDNEDCHVSLRYQAVWVVADGMGGHHNGRFASQAIADAVEAAQLPDDLQLACDAVAGAIQSANATIFAKSREVGKQMGSTAVALIVRGREFAVLWAGDSRAYVFRDDTLVQLTHDHTQVDDMVERGLLTHEEAADHPMKHVLSRAVGVQPVVELDAVRDEIVAKDLFLLCSDGLHGVIGDAEIAAILRRRGSDAADELIAACLERGAPDNVTVTLVEASEPTLLNVSGGSL